MNLPSAPSRRRVSGEHQRERLLHGAARVVAEFGFAGASVQRITAACGLSQGSLYTYFDSLQALLDQVLPTEGASLLAALRKAAEGGQGYFDIERRTFEMLAAYLRRKPAIYRLTTEGEFATPAGYRQYFDDIVTRYLRAMKRGQAEGEVRCFDDESLDVAARTLSYVRGAIIRGFCDPDARRLLHPRALPDWLSSAFERFLRHGIGAIAPVPQQRFAPSDATRLRPQTHGDDGARAPHGPAVTRARIISASMELIGLHGNSETTVAAICAKADVGIGTFYGHFPARSDLLPIVLAEAGAQLREAIKTSTAGSESYLEYEARAFDGYSDFVAVHPWYPRLEVEAAINAPAAFLEYVHTMSAQVVQAIAAHRIEPEFAAFNEREWPVISHIVVAARHFLAIDWSSGHATSIRPNANTRRTWLEVLARGLQAQSDQSIFSSD